MTNYYEVLGVSKKASNAEITEAKNKLAKKYHPDIHIKDGIDTTEKMQEILEAYTILSDPEARAEYDRMTFSRSRTMQTFNLHDLKDETTGEQCYPSFLTYWKTASTLNDLVTESLELFKMKRETNRLKSLSKSALRCAAILRNASIPEKYWHPEVMNWLLFQWYQNRNYSTAYLLTLYDEHLRSEQKASQRFKLEGRYRAYQRQIKKLIKY